MRTALAVLGAGAALAAVPTAWAALASLRYRYTVAQAPPRPVAIVLGAAAWESGPSPLLARRLDIAAELLLGGKVGVVLVSGDNRECSRFETDAMTDYLVARGVPKEAVVADPAGYRTWDTCARARDVYRVDAAVIVTQNFHLPRAVALARAAGMDAVGVGDPSLGGRTRSTVYGYAREVGANAKALYDAVRQPAPAVTGGAAPEAVERIGNAT
ncbi:vancomycin permeability regulator SanA [Actinorugispora endophytica]|uniref:Vancomycin permeability regulator SanA n=1 Tax=Actinorugispora endophytica TaxID=1605990 RepID=A0A4R6UFD0_9ACTN|nr:vancomycin permeability regulator SanA [Actinorugispora endophytica]